MASSNIDASKNSPSSVPKNFTNTANTMPPPKVPAAGTQGFRSTGNATLGNLNQVTAGQSLHLKPTYLAPSKKTLNRGDSLTQAGTQVHRGSAFQRLKERMTTAVDSLHQRLSPEYKHQVESATLESKTDSYFTGPGAGAGAGGVLQDNAIKEASEMKASKPLLTAVNESSRASPATSLLDVNMSSVPALPPFFVEDIKHISQNVAPTSFMNLEAQLQSAGGLAKVVDQVYVTFQQLGLNENARKVRALKVDKDAYRHSLASIFADRSDTVQLSAQSNGYRIPIRQSSQLDGVVDLPVFFEHAGSYEKNKNLLSTRRMALKLNPNSYADAASLACRLLSNFPDIVDTIKLFPLREIARQDNLVIYLKKDAPSTDSKQFGLLVESLSGSGICRNVSAGERILGMKQLGAMGMYYVDNPPLVLANDSIPGAMPPFNSMGKLAPKGSHGAFMALVVIASNLLATREKIPFEDAVQKVWQFAWETGGEPRQDASQNH